MASRSSAKIRFRLPQFVSHSRISVPLFCVSPHVQYNTYRFYVLCLIRIFVLCLIPMFSSFLFSVSILFHVVSCSHVQVLDLDLDLRTVRYKYWKLGGEMKLYYREAEQKPPAEVMQAEEGEGRAETNLNSD